MTSQTLPPSPARAKLDLVSIPKYPKHGPLRDELIRRVDAYFSDNNLSKSGGWRLLLKGLTILAWFCLSYIAMVFWAEPFWLVALCAISFGLAQAGIGFSVMHDGGHGASSKKPWVNWLAAHGLDFIGGSSKLWNFKHNIIHHQFPNIDGVDSDIIVEPWLRLAATQKRRKIHRAQHIYFPLAYAFLAAKWLFHDDFATLIKRRMGRLRTPPIRWTKVVEILTWKVFVVGWSLVLPIAMHGVGWTLAVLAIWAGVCGIAMAIVFQCAHAVDGTAMTALPAKGERLERTWAEQQLASTMDFAPNNRIVTWYVGGLNFQVEHHLFPKISHVHYPAIAPIVRKVCAEFDVPYHVRPSARAAVGGHLRHLWTLGRRPERATEGVTLVSVGR